MSHAIDHSMRQQSLRGNSSGGASSSLAPAAPSNWQECAAAGMTVSEAARFLGKSHQAGAKYRARHGVVFAQHKQTLPHDDVVARMFAEGATWGQIAKATGKTYEGVRGVAYRLGLKRARTSISESPTKATVHHRAYKQKHPEKHRAHQAVTRARADGRLVPQVCETCGERETHAHHDDYSKSLDVRWLCHRCHEAEHHRKEATA